MLGVILGSILSPGLFFIVGLTYKKENPKLAKDIIGAALSLAVILMVKTLIVPLKVMGDDGEYIVDMMSTGTSIMSYLMFIVAMIAALANMSSCTDSGDKSSDTPKEPTSDSVDEEDDYDDDLL